MSGCLRFKGYYGSEQVKLYALEDVYDKNYPDIMPNLYEKLYQRMHPLAELLDIILEHEQELKQQQLQCIHRELRDLEDTFEKRNTYLDKLADYINKRDSQVDIYVEELESEPPVFMVHVTSNGEKQTYEEHEEEEVRRIYKRYNKVY